MASEHTSVSVDSLGISPQFSPGITFGVPWPRNKCQAQGTVFKAISNEGQAIPLESWTNAYWPDGSVKWTGHALPGSFPLNEIHSVQATTQGVHPTLQPEGHHHVIAESTEHHIEVKTGKISVQFPFSGENVIKSITTEKGNVVGEHGHLLLLSCSVAAGGDRVGGSGEDFKYRSQVEETSVERIGPVRAVVKVQGKHILHDDNEHARVSSLLPFCLRFYLYAGSDGMRIVHTFTYDGNPHKFLIRGIGLHFDVPLGDEPLYDRHIRFSSADGGLLSEAVQGVTGLRKDPGASIRKRQVEGKPLPPLNMWEADFVAKLKWVPSWSDYSLMQLSPDGFTLRKRTRAGHSWVNIPGGAKSGGLAYLGGGNKGGLAIGMKDFWERYPTQLDIRNATESTAQMILWLYSPSAEPMDLRPYHDGLQQHSFEDQLDALLMTYEDWEENLGSPYGIARTNEIYISAFDKTPDSSTLASLTEYIRNPPVLVAEVDAIYRSEAFGAYWSPSSYPSGLPMEEHRNIEQNLEFLFHFYQSQVSQRRWYGFWDYGDIMHTYDVDRHCWRYDIGGYAWDNSELSPDLWLWLYFLRTGRLDVYRLAESLTRHTGEVDVYHLGPYRGLGTRHGVQHWSDSCKQVRISNAIYRRFLYYLSGGDERIGDLLTETLDAEQTFLALDPYRKVRKDKPTYRPDATTLSIGLGTDWSALAAAWFIEYERRGPRAEVSLQKLTLTMKGIGSLANGFVTGRALYNLHTGNISPPAEDPENHGIVLVSHLSAMFGLVEICADLLSSFPDPAFESAWLSYCLSFNASATGQTSRYGTPFKNLQLRQGHSRLTAYAAHRLKDPALAARAWHEFYTGDGYAADEPWETERVQGSSALVPVDEASWVSTNISALYGLAAIQNLALVGKGEEGWDNPGRQDQ